MRKLFFYFFVLVCVLLPFYSVIAQSSVSSATQLKEKQEKLLHNINIISIDSNIVRRLSPFIRSAVDSIRLLIYADHTLPAPEKEKAEQSLIFFLDEMGENIMKQKMDVYDIAGAIDTYRNILKALLYHKPFTTMMTSPGPRRSYLLARAFRQYKDFPLLDDIAVYKRMMSTPEFIAQFLENQPGFRYADSLLVYAAVYDPLKLTGNTSLQNNIHHTKNIYLHQVVALAGDKNAKELLPFVTQIAENSITPDSVLKIRMDIGKYFQLMVNGLKESAGENNPSFVFRQLIRNGIKEKSLSFYVNHINDQHSAADAVRFAPVKDLRPEDLYYIITSCGEELYTSSYLGLYKRLMIYFKGRPADSLFSIVQYDNFRIFMRMAANYNVLTNFLSSMPREKAADLLTRFISGIEADTQSGLEKAMDIADTFTGLDSVAWISDLIQKELRTNLYRCQSGQQYFGVRLYSILLQVFELVQQKNSFNKLWSTLGNYEILERKALQNKKSEIVELVLFYGDEDGVASFNNFKKLFTDTGKWEMIKQTSWITIRSRSDEPVIIYANMPLDNKEELDLKAQDSLFTFLEQQFAEPSVLIHRGHSYHLSNTLKRLTPSVKLAILGSCGGYNNAISIASISPDVQIIASKKTGAKSINDPLIDLINETLQDKRSIYWSALWDTLTTKFAKDESTLNMFNEYIPPGKNVSLFVLKLFNHSNRVH